MPGMQDSHTFSVFTGRWALPAGRQPGMPASSPLPLALHPAPAALRDTRGLSTTLGRVWPAPGESQKAFCSLFCHFNSDTVIESTSCPSCNQTDNCDHLSLSGSKSLNEEEVYALKLWAFLPDHTVPTEVLSLTHCMTLAKYLISLCLNFSSLKWG